MRESNRQTVAIDNRRATATRACRDQAIQLGVTVVAPSPYRAATKGARS